MPKPASPKSTKIKPQMDKKAVLHKRGPRDPRQVTIKVWLDNDVIDKFQATGPGWHGRINEVLRKARVG